MKKSTVILLFGMLFAFTVRSQSDWKQLYSENGISISYTETDCRDRMGHMQHVYLMKVENTTAALKLVEWNFELTDNEGKCTGCSGNNAEQHRAIKIAANETVEGNCDPQASKDVRKFMRFLDMKTKKEIAAVKVVGIKVSDLNQ